MIKNFLILLFLIFSLNSSVFPEGEAYRFLDSRFNGRFVMESGIKEVFCYLLGIIDCAYKTNPFEMTKLYPNANKSDIIRKVQDYYHEHPEERYRPIVNVVFSGCK